MSSPVSLVDACRVPESVPEAKRFPWQIIRFQHRENMMPPERRMWTILGLGDRYKSYTALARATWETMHEPIGEVVMEDSPRELRRHLPILLAGRGRILVSGLGLGCVVRWLLSKPDVAHIDVIEIDETILELIGPEFAGNDRVTLHHGDAETIELPRSLEWDYAWHDVWSERESLALVHTRLMLRFAKRCRRQGAWMFPREFKKRIPRISTLNRF